MTSIFERAKNSVEEITKVAQMPSGTATAKNTTTGYAGTEDREHSPTRSMAISSIAPIVASTAFSGLTTGLNELVDRSSGPASTDEVRKLKKLMRIDPEIVDWKDYGAVQALRDIPMPEVRSQQYAYSPASGKVLAPENPGIAGLAHEFAHHSPPDGKLNPLRWNRNFRFSPAHNFMYRPVLRYGGLAGQLAGAALGSKEVTIPSMIATGLSEVPTLVEEARANIGAIRNLAKLRGGLRHLQRGDILVPALSMAGYLGHAGLSLLPGILGLWSANKNRKETEITEKISANVVEPTKTSAKFTNTEMAKNIKNTTTDERLWKRRPALIGKKNLGRKRLMDPSTENSSRKLYKDLL